MLNHRSSSKPNLGISNGKVKDPQIIVSKSTMNSGLAQTQSHNFLPAKQVVNGAIQTLNVNMPSQQPLSGSQKNNGNTAKAQQLASVARLYQSHQPGSNVGSKDMTNTSS